MIREGCTAVQLGATVQLLEISLNESVAILSAEHIKSAGGKGGLSASIKVVTGRAKRKSLRREEKKKEERMTEMATKHQSFSGRSAKQL